MAVGFAPAAGSPDANAIVNGLEVYTVTPLDAWRVATFPPAQLDDAASSGLTADIDRDGSNTLLEYALGTNALAANASGQGITTASAQGRLALTFPRARAELTYVVEGSGDLRNWTAVATNPGVAGQSVTVTDNAAANTTPHFLRLRVTH